ncbi:hypothetical protein MMC30_007791 [Trapelia coarctata]|nr:hypothetical protein [Trapelia coarctata]
MWEWANGGKPGLLVKLVTVDVAEGAKFGKGRATQVISGWAGSSAYINGAGIVIWDRMPELDEASLIDAYLMESFTIPGTSFKRNQADLHSDSSLESCIGEVLNHIVLENSIVFITHLNKVFAYHLSYRLKPGFSPVELTTFRQTSLSFRIEDIQGSFHNFGVFSRDGAVLLGDTTLINSFIDASIQSPNFTLHPRNTRSEAPLPQPFVPSALQCTSVVSLAFGDYHYHALHADGTISSHGTEPLACGAFGLGYQSLAMVRGVHYASWEGIIPTPSAPAPSLQSPSPDNLASLKTIWFETEKAEWLRRLHSYSAVAEKYRSQNMMNQEPPEMVQSFREWIERQGCAWHLGPLGRRTRKMPLSSDMTSTYITSDSDSEDHPDKGAYFAVKVSAAGWHSAALVLVDTEKAERVRRKYIVSSSASGATPNTGANVEEASCRVSLPPSSETTASASSGSNLRGIGTSLHQAGRRFLGLTLRDEMQAEISRNHASAEAAQQSRTPRYVWDDIPFPRLVGLDGWERKRGADGGFG